MQCVFVCGPGHQLSGLERYQIDKSVESASGVTHVWCSVAMLPMLQPEPLLFNSGGQSDEAATAPATVPLPRPPSLTPDSDVDGLVDIFFDVDVAVDTFQR